jgi:oxygen-independent coproporphyrinogen-3 oxidase
VQPRHMYVHVPFCARRCTYCDFAIAVRRVVPVDDYLAALDAELQLRWEDARLQLDTLYFGGGTPSRLGGDGVARAIDSVRRVATLAAGAEVTIEANPEDVTPAAARAWRAVGVNRVSLGVQSSDDSALSWMHRVHNAARAERAVGELRDAGIENFSIDLIFALPDEAGARSWERDLQRAIALEPPHVSLYGLTVEAHTPLGKALAVGGITEAGEDRYERDFLAAHEAMTAAGLEHYEVSNFGRAGMHSRHNAAYWRSVPYAGIGPGAHELRVNGDRMVRRWNDDAYVRWAASLGAGRDPVAGDETLTPENRIAEEVYLGMRTRDGLAIRPGERERFAAWADSGWGAVDVGADTSRAPGEGGLVFRPTPLGWLRLDALAADLTAFRSR